MTLETASALAAMRPKYPWPTVLGVGEARSHAPTVFFGAGDAAGSGGTAPTARARDPRARWPAREHGPPGRGGGVPRLPRNLALAHRLHGPRSIRVDDLHRGRARSLSVRRDGGARLHRGTRGERR